MTSTAGATHFSDWRAGALAGLAAAFTALKATATVQLNGAQRPSPASLIRLPGRAAVQVPVPSEAQATVVRAA
jgi:hypothetical protein